MYNCKHVKRETTCKKRSCKKVTLTPDVPITVKDKHCDNTLYKNLFKLCRNCH